jgi:hypothetical protein
MVGGMIGGLSVIGHLGFQFQNHLFQVFKFSSKPFHFLCPVLPVISAISPLFAG